MEPVPMANAFNVAFQSIHEMELKTALNKMPAVNVKPKYAKHDIVEVRVPSGYWQKAELGDMISGSGGKYEGKWKVLEIEDGTLEGVNETWWYEMRNVEPSHMLEVHASGDLTLDLTTLLRPLLNNPGHPDLGFIAQHFGKFNVTQTKTGLGKGGRRGKVWRNVDVVLECGKLALNDHRSLRHDFDLLGDISKNKPSFFSSTDKCFTISYGKKRSIFDKKPYNLCHDDAGTLAVLKHSISLELNRLDSFESNDRPCRAPVFFNQMIDCENRYFSVRKEQCFAWDR